MYISKVNDVCIYQYVLESMSQLIIVQADYLT